MKTKLDDIAHCLRGHKGKRGAFMFGVSEDGFQDFFADVNARMLAGKKEVSRIELDSMVVAANKRPAPKPTLALPAPSAPRLEVKPPDSLSIDECYGIVNGIEANPSLDGSTTGPDACHLMRKRLAEFRADGITALKLSKWQKVSGACVELAYLEQLLGIQEKQIAQLQALEAAESHG